MALHGKTSRNPARRATVHAGRVLAVLAVLGAAPVFSSGEEPACPAPESQTAAILTGKVDKRFFLAPDTRAGSVDGRFTNFTGAYGGWLLNRRVMVGLGFWGNTNDTDLYNVDYGGLVLEAFANPDDLVNFSGRVLVGGGEIEPEYAPHGAVTDLRGDFFVAEPEARVFVNVTRRVRLGLGVGYRFVAGARGQGRDLSSVSASASLTLKGF